MIHTDTRRRNGPVTSRQATPEELARIRLAYQAGRRYQLEGQGIAMHAHVIPHVPAEAFARADTTGMIFGQKQPA